MDEQTVVSGKCSGSSNITASSSFEKLYFSSDWPLLPNLHDHQILVLYGLAEVSQLLYILYRIPKTNICKLCWKTIFVNNKKILSILIPRVADTLYNPFGEDDDDFELNELINRLVKSCTSIQMWNLDPPPSPPQALPSWDEHRGQHQTSASPSQGRFLGPGLHFSTFFLPATGNSWGYLGSDFYLVVALFSFAKSVIS